MTRTAWPLPPGSGVSAVTTHFQPDGVTWNQDPDQRSTVSYQDGFYSRADREFVGFKTVTTTRIGEQSTVEETYDTSDVYHKGLHLYGANLAWAGERWKA